MKTSNDRSDFLPSGENDSPHLKKDKEWPNLSSRLGSPRIMNHHFFPEIFDWVKQKEDLSNFSYFEAGCGHGNDLRIMKKVLGSASNFLGVDLSKEEIMRGLDFYAKRDGEKTDEAIKMFGLGDLHDLSLVNIWEDKDQDFSCYRIINDEEFYLVYLEAVLQAAGYGYSTYEEKKNSALKILKELSRVCKTEGKFFGRITGFSSIISKEQQFAILREDNRWHFVPELDEFMAMLRLAGFDNIQRVVRPHEDADTVSNKKHYIRISFLAEKIRQ